MPRKLLIGLVAALSAFVGLVGNADAAFNDAAFNIAGWSGSLLRVDGTPLTQAGGHPDFTTRIQFPTVESEAGEIVAANVKDVDTTLPAGLVGDPEVAAECTPLELIGSKHFGLELPECSKDSQIGTAEPEFCLLSFCAGTELGLYVMVPPPGVAAEFGFLLSGVPTLIDATVHDEAGEYSIAADVSNITQGVVVKSTQLTFWGVPGDPSHDGSRRSGFETGVSSSLSPLPLMRNPTSCSTAPLSIRAEADSWQEPGLFSPASFDHDPLGNPIVTTNCESVPFGVRFAAKPTTEQADSPSGLDVEVKIPQPLNPDAPSTADLKKAVITLPEGMAVNPSSANGLGSCTMAQAHLSDDHLAECPGDSKIGSVQIQTPLLKNPLPGSIFLAKQGENNFGSLLAIYLSVEDPQHGVVLKLPGLIQTSASGRVTATFDDAPQLPFETLNVELFGGSRASLRTPAACGSYSVGGSFTPWSGTEAISGSSGFSITMGPEGQPCPNGGFDPRLEAGTTNPTGGSYSPFTLRLSREDGTQQISTLSATLPKGVLAKLSGIPYCSDATLAGIPSAEGTGLGQLGSPSCPSASQVGTVSVRAGSGSSPVSVDTGKAYLAGPYKDAPLSLAVVVPALAGPFDLGNVVVRNALQVNPETTQVTATSDPLPTILDGIPLDIREILVNVNRNEFTLNPTSCEPMEVSSTIGGTGGGTAHPSSRFQVGSCEGLPFKPSLSLKLKGKTKRTGHPALTATLTFPKGATANTAKAQVGLPHSEFLDQANIGTVCTRPQLAAHACPAKSVYGHATAVTPLLDQPLSGPVFLGTGYGTKLPMLVAELNGQIDVVLRGKIDTDPQGGIRATFAQVPDAPISKFTLAMQGGKKKGLIENSTDICKAKQKATLAFGGQNGKQLNQKVSIAASCGGGKKKSRTR